MAAGDEQLGCPVRQQGRQRRVAEGPLASFLRQVVIKVVEDNEVRPSGSGGKVGRGNLAVDDADHTSGLHPGDPGRDLAGQRRLAATADAVDHQPGRARTAQVGGPEPTLGGPDRQRRTPAWPGTGTACVLGRMPRPSLVPGRRRLAWTEIARKRGALFPNTD